MTGTELTRIAHNESPKMLLIVHPVLQTDILGQVLFTPFSQKLSNVYSSILFADRYATTPDLLRIVNC